MTDTPTDLPDFASLMDRADRAAPRVPVVAAGAADVTVLEALRQAHDRRWIAPILAGDAAHIEVLAAERGINLSDVELVDTAKPAATSVAQVVAGKAKILLKGQISTPDLLRAMLNPEHGLRTGRTICQVVLMHIRRDRRRFLLADTGICVQPSLAQKRDILESLVELAKALGVRRPRVAIMAATETIHPDMPETADAAELQRLTENGPIQDCIVQGPLSFDLAYAAAAGDKKRLHGPVTGHADIMLFPNLVSANLAVKAMMYTADCEFGGVLRGAACPVAFMSRADDMPTRLHSLALALALSSSKE